MHDFAARILADVEMAVALLQAAGFVHRDIHQANTMVTPEHRAVLIDFNWSTDDMRKRNMDLESLWELSEERETDEYNDRS